MGNSNEMSFIDIIKINRRYKCRAAKTVNVFYDKGDYLDNALTQK